MVIRPYLALSPGEIQKFSPQGPLGVLLCCAPFSPGLLLGQCRLPPGTLPIFTDRVSPSFHSAGRIARELNTLAKQLASPALVLDWAGPSTPWLEELVQQLEAPAVLPEHLAPLFPGAVLVKTPIEKPLEEALKPWQGRNLWLDASPGAASLVLTGKGCQVLPRAGRAQPGDLWDDVLCCNYRVETTEEKATFFLYETRESWEKKLEKACALGVTNAVGLWKDFQKGN